MNFKCANQILVNEIYATGDNNKYECLASITNFSTLREWISVGESLTSNEFSMLFPNSIGESKWKVLFFPKGQYINDKGSSCTRIYLVLQSCDKEDEALDAFVTFQLKSKNENIGLVKKANAKFAYPIGWERWIGLDFVSKKWLNSKRSEHFFDNDTLVISCSVEETIPRHDSKELMSLRSEMAEDNGRQTGLQKRCSYYRDNFQKNSDAHCEAEADDFQNNNAGDWCNVSSGKKHKKQLPKNPVTSKQKNNGEPKRKKKSKNRGKKKK